MLFLGRILIVIAVLAGLGYAALYAIAGAVEPEQRDIVVTIPMPKLPTPKLGMPGFGIFDPGPGG